MKLLIFGYGFTGKAVARVWRRALPGTFIGATSRSDATRAAVAQAGLAAHDFPLPDPAAALSGVTHVLVTVPPGDAGDPVLAAHQDNLLTAAPHLSWIGYVSTTGVYGNCDGGEVTEESALAPTAPRSQRRVEAEQAWRDFGARARVPVVIFRAAGIYGPGRSALDNVREGTARRIVKADHLFSRIHVDDLARVIVASARDPAAGSLFNVCDDLPAAPHLVIEEACRLLSAPLPPLENFADARATMSAMAQSFWADNKRVSNARMKAAFPGALHFPTYVEGLRHIKDSGA